MKLVGYLRRILRCWFGLGTMTIGVDIGSAKGDKTCVVLASISKDGSMEIKSYWYGSAEEMRQIVNREQKRHGIVSKNIIRDYYLEPIDKENENE